jgi:hypothetical protein
MPSCEAYMYRWVAQSPDVQCTVTHPPPHPHPLWLLHITTMQQHWGAGVGGGPAKIALGAYTGEERGQGPFICLSQGVVSARQ